MKRLLILMAKAPVPGEVKTRLQPFLSEEQSAALSTALIRDTEAKALAVDFEVVFAVSPPDGAVRVSKLLSSEHRIMPQKGESLGDRMHNAFSDTISVYGAAALMIGTDCPMMPSSTLEEGFRLLEEGSEAVLGPSEDGGYYLIGLSKASPLVFEGVEWSSDAAFAQTVANLRRLGIEPELLPTEYDIDVRPDLERLFKELSVDPELAPNTSKWLVEHRHLFKICR